MAKATPWRQRLPLLQLAAVRGAHSKVQLRPGQLSPQQLRGATSVRLLARGSRSRRCSSSSNNTSHRSRTSHSSHRISRRLLFQGRWQQQKQQLHAGLLLLKQLARAWAPQHRQPRRQRQEMQSRNRRVLLQQQPLLWWCRQQPGQLRLAQCHRCVGRAAAGSLTGSSRPPRLLQLRQRLLQLWCAAAGMLPPRFWPLRAACLASLLFLLLLA
jgi:hypothetical protein